MRSDEAIEQVAYLKEIINRTRLKAAEGYPWLILWGIIYLLGYTSVYFFGQFVWIVLITVGGLLSIIIPTIQKIRKRTVNRRAPSLIKKIGMQCLILVISGGLIFKVLVTHRDWTIVNAYWPFLIGVIYMVAGVHIGWDMILIGFWIALVSIISIFIPPQYQSVWLGITAGGGLLFTGILFRYQFKKAGKEIGK